MSERSLSHHILCRNDILDERDKHRYQLCEEWENLNFHVKERKMGVCK